MENKVPALIQKGGTWYLEIDGQPVFLRAGEIHNSSASSLQYMEKNVWPYVETMNLNALIVPVYWECVEPEEGVYDFSLVEGLLAQARARNMRLVLLWFGLWKNGCTDYAPGWVKWDRERFQRILDRDGSLPIFRERMRLIVTPLCGEAVDADARCFAALMRFLREADGEMHTVVMVQVENEVGVLGSDRDYSELAQKEYARPVPLAIREKLSLSGSTWKECFGADAAERFMAWHYAKAVEQIALAGKREYALPMYCNAWLRQEGRLAGEYPSGGPQLHNMEIWKIAAPGIDFFAPDIYVREYRQICDDYRAAGNPLCIPEVFRTADAAPCYFYALGRHGALCFSPFGIEDMMQQDTHVDAATLQQLDISAEAMTSGSDAGAILTCAYGLTAGMGEVLTSAVLDDRTYGFLEAGEIGCNLELSGCILRVSYDQEHKPGKPLAGGMVVELGAAEFVVAACSCSIAVEGKDGKSAEVELYEEGRYESGIWQRSRILNGDERYGIHFGPMPQMLRCRIFEL